MCFDVLIQKIMFGMYHSIMGGSFAQHPIMDSIVSFSEIASTVVSVFVICIRV
jgi:hypothetical protein